MSQKLATPRMLALTADMSGPTYWRVLAPFTALEKKGYPCGWAPKNDRLVGAIAPDFDGYVLSRVSWPGEAHLLAVRWFAMLKSAGKLVVYDADDDIFTDACVPHLVESGLAEGLTTTQIQERRAAGVWALQQADGVTVSTPYLADVIRTVTDRPVLVVPNAIDLGWFRMAAGPSRRDPHAPTVGWIGGRRSDADVASMAVAWGRIARRYPRVTFVVGGHRPPVVDRHVPAERVAYLPWRPIERYPSLYTGLDIGCAPVADTPFNRSKSDIKAQEYAAAGAAVVASPLLYAGLVEGGETGYLAETADEWTDAITELIERPAHRAILAKRLARRVERECSLKENLHRWPAAWAEIQATARSGDARLTVA